MGKIIASISIPNHIKTKCTMGKITISSRAFQGLGSAQEQIIAETILKKKSIRQYWFIARVY
jgi:hypothetical protein